MAYISPLSLGGYSQPGYQPGVYTGGSPTFNEAAGGTTLNTASAPTSGVYSTYGGTRPGYTNFGGIGYGDGWEYEGLSKQGRNIFINPTTGQRDWRMDDGQSYNVGQSYGFGADPNTNAMSSGGTPYNAAGVPQTGLIGSEAALMNGLAGGTSAVQQGLGQATQSLSPYTSAGAASSDLQAALSGALGPEAQQAAYASYMEGPGTSYLREMGEKAITRNASATGGLQGGNVLQELQRHGIGIAAQDFNDSFNRLGSLSDRGYNASNSLAGIQANAGGRIGDYNYGTGQSLSTGRTRAGEQIASNITAVTSALATLMGQQGSDLSNILGQSGSNIAQLLAGLGINDAQSLQQLASLLGNVNMGASNQTSGLPQIPASTFNASNEWGNVASALGNVATSWPQSAPPPPPAAPSGSLYNGTFNTQSGISG